ncbi:unnamed protein product [Lactuca saligna]|uniref:Transcription repressor n=1 Tax=Lactuca saligna TaxID=75948 RepID=A0AA35ZV23_LACSI|nr:unnamed protein product [Lactuca saligna]
MAKHKLRLSHMIPNAWFYRLRDMNTKPLSSAYSSSTSKQHNHSRNSICYTPTLQPVYTTNIIHNPPSPKHPLCTQPTEPIDHTHQDLFLSPTSCSYKYPFSESTRSTPPSTFCSRELITASTTDNLQKLPPIITKPTKSSIDKSTMVEKNEGTRSKSSVSIKTIKENISKKETAGGKPVSEIKIRSNSSKTPVCKRMVHDNNDDKRKKKLSSSRCIVKSSFDPQKDLKESMLEMILENNIRESKDLEKLLACYLSWNSNEYHDMIVKAFEQIWLNFNFSSLVH